ncbi:HMG domain-containing protein 3-like isoform X4 [Montipora capricornis]|uniref:HMG domain-containing protein 3-like isoform X4 n=1 Tax=Montipora capricornis TaxID=246305 RepID=UPI0035F19B24
MASSGLKSSQRGKGQCPNCKASYTNRYKPEVCSQCGFLLGGSFVQKHPKRTKLDSPSCSSVVLGTWNVYSCKTSNRDDRCLVIKDRRQGNTSVVCEHHNCKEARGRSSDFTCQHIKSTLSATPPTSSYYNIPNLQEYQCGDSVKTELMSLEKFSGDLPLAVEVSPTVFCVFGPVTSNTPAGYCHVQVKRDTIRCCSKDCKTIIAKAKQHKAKNICIHVHILISLGVMLSNKEASAIAHVACEPTNAGAPTSTAGSSLLDALPTVIMPPETGTGEPLDSISRTSTIQLNMRRSLPLAIPIAVLKQAHSFDVSGWPPSLAPSSTTCGLCDSPLSKERCHPGQRGESLLITNMNPFKPITLLVKFCENPSCQAMHQVFPYNLGLFNIADKVLVSLEIMVEWRHLFRRGVPLSTAIEGKLEAMKERTQEPPGGNELKNLGNLLYNGFYCFEAITERNLDDVICGICGTIGELYLGDGNEKNCCSISEINYAPRDCVASDPISLEKFLLKLKERWVECTTYTRCSKKLEVYQTSIPPIIPPSMRNPDQVLNTEDKKKSSVLDSIKHKYQGKDED